MAPCSGARAGAARRRAKGSTLREQQRLLLPLPLLLLPASSPPWPRQPRGRDGARARLHTKRWRLSRRSIAIACWGSLFLPPGFPYLGPGEQGGGRRRKRGGEVERPNLHMLLGPCAASGARLDARRSQHRSARAACTHGRQRACAGRASRTAASAFSPHGCNTQRAAHSVVHAADAWSRSPHDQPFVSASGSLQGGVSAPCLVVSLLSGGGPAICSIMSIMSIMTILIEARPSPEAHTHTHTLHRTIHHYELQRQCSVAWLCAWPGR